MRSRTEHVGSASYKIYITPENMYKSKWISHTSLTIAYSSRGGGIFGGIIRERRDSTVSHKEFSARTLNKLIINIMRGLRSNAKNYVSPYLLAEAMIIPEFMADTSWAPAEQDELAASLRKFHKFTKSS